MKKMIIIAALAAVGLVPVAAQAQERLGDAALGAVSGALVAGPVGLVAGGIVGFTAGPAIASTWGLRHRGRPHRVAERPAQ
jgi:hypothetical protein